MRVVFDSRWTGTSGIARFSAEVRARMTGVTDLPAGLDLFSVLALVRARRFCSRIDPDAWFSPGFNPSPVPGVPFGFTIHDLNYVFEPSVSDPIRRAYFQVVVRPACARAAFIATPSEYSKARIVHWARVPESRVACVGGGVAKAFRPAGPVHAHGPPYFLYVGNRLPHKNLPTLVAGFAASGLAGEYRLMFTGRPSSPLTALARRLSVDNAVVFAGEPDEIELASLYRGAVALVLPSRAEGFGLPAVESMACGTPVILARAGSLPEIAGTAGVFFDPGDPDELAEVLRQIASDSDLRRRQIQAGLIRAARFSWQGTADSIISLLRQAAAT